MSFIILYRHNINTSYIILSQYNFLYIVSRNMRNMIISPYCRPHWPRSLPEAPELRGPLAVPKEPDQGLLQASARSAAIVDQLISL
jgi:hypothetical protein